MRQYIPESVKNAARKLLFPVPAHLSARQRQIDRTGMLAVERSIRENYHAGWRGESSYSKTAYAADLREHLWGRLEHDRR